MELLYSSILFLVSLYSIFAAPQNPEINDQFESTTDSETTVLFIETGNPVTEIKNNNAPNNSVNIDEIETPLSHIVISNKTMQLRAKAKNEEAGFFARIYTAVTAPLRTFMLAPKVNSVLRNIGTCVVNGAMELISHYLPAPLMPLIASAAGMFIPFEPVVMLRDRMPVTSYRRAFKTAMNTFLGTFDKFKVDDNFDDDPYMTMRFNRRFMNEQSGERKKRNWKKGGEK